MDRSSAVETFETLKQQRPERGCEIVTNFLRENARSMAAITSSLDTVSDGGEAVQVSKQKFEGKFIAVGLSKQFALFSTRDGKAPIPFIYAMYIKVEGTSILIPKGYCFPAVKANIGDTVKDLHEGLEFEKVVEVLAIEEADAKYMLRKSGARQVPWRLMLEVVMAVAIIKLWASRRPPALPSPGLAAELTRA